MIICVANTSPKKVRTLLKDNGYSFAMWKSGTEISPDVHYGYFNFDDLRHSKPKKTPFFFNIISAFDHVGINHPIHKFDYRNLPNGLVFFKPPNMEEIEACLQEKWLNKEIRDVLFRPTKVDCYESSELARLWNNFVVTLPFCVAEAFMVCFLQCVRNNDKEAFKKFIVDNRLIGTGNKQAFAELEGLIKTLWPVFVMNVNKDETTQSKTKKFFKVNKNLESSLSRFLFWNRSYKGKDLSEYMDEEDNVSYGVN